MASDSLVDYLEGIAQFCEAIRGRALAQRDLGGETMERAVAVVALEGWAQQEDYVEKIQYFVEQLTKHGDLLMLENEEGEALRGIVLFINGMVQGHHNIQGFRSNTRAESGWLLCRDGAEKLRAHFDAQGGFMESLFFKDMSDWFGAIHAGQQEFLETLVEINDWNQMSATGFYNVLPMASPFFQGQLLAALSPSSQHPWVKAEIIDPYLANLVDQRQAFLDAYQKDKAAQMDQLIALLKAGGRVNADDN